MTDDAGATTVLLVGALLVRLSVSGAYERYVRSGMGVWLLIAGVLLVALGIAGLVRALTVSRPRRGDGSDGHGWDGHGADRHGSQRHPHRGDRVGWLLLGPVVALLLVTPPALGSFGVDRSPSVNVAAGGRTFDPLPSGRTVPMSLIEFGQRAADHDGASFGSTPVRLTGFVARTSDGDGFRIARYQIACCAADAVAAVVRVVGATGDPPARDQWVTATGTFRRSADGVPELVVSSLTEVPAPPDPYE